MSGNDGGETDGLSVGAKVAVAGVAEHLVATAAPAPAPARIAQAKRIPRPHREPLTIKLQTSDPNIVIYWIAD